MTDNSEARERMAEAIHDAWNMSGVPYGHERAKAFRTAKFETQADAVIAHLWRRAESTEVVAAFATEFMCADHGGLVGPATPIHFLLTELIGTRPEGVTDER